MIELTKLNKQADEKYYLNCDMIELVEGRPDTTIRLANGKHFVVADTVEEVIGKIVAYQRSIRQPWSMDMVPRSLEDND